ncbi:trypsin-like serine peptidase [Staphylococcus caprae]|uniref:Serine protease n=2 Tax=Staphylococcus TaxID=1279 RepID=A0ABM7FMX4_9STAP|nr:serine protease [Staphylococcus caprae]EES41495.1 glutamyl endopeptidase [Staphylococcus caprae M23864:W1]MBN6826480.1 serine protease [Staphylococcus caprae]MBX5323323.1 serine protease [Staphylococcus caprae]MDI0014710.1 serine protease [Staphylococcus caprae]MEB8094899.1 serine protease [Staphylococcus caprae]
MRKIFLSIGFITIAILATTVLLNISQASEKSTPQADSMHQASHKKVTNENGKANKKVKPLGSRKFPSVILPNNNRHQISNTQEGHYAPVSFVKIYNDNGDLVASGSGIVVGENEILTNKHIVDAAHNNPDNLGVAPSSKSESEMPNGEFKGQEIKKYPGNGDLSILKVQPNEDNKKIGDVVTPAKISSNSNTQTDQDITVTGYPGDKPLATMWESKGKILSINGNQMTYDLSTYGGNSGSPVFNENNEVIGIHYGGVEHKHNSAVFINEDVQNFLKQNIPSIQINEKNTNLEKSHDGNNNYKKAA